VLLGLVAAAVLTRLLQSQLYQTSPLDPGIYAAVVLLMLVVSVLAVNRAGSPRHRLDPISALRHE
jgi:putative ABC transport system permease protein